MWNTGATSVSITVTQSGTYSLTQTANGCTSEAASVAVTLKDPFNPGEILSTGETVCNGGDPALIGSATPATGGDGDYTYLWKANGTDIASSNSPTFDPPAGITTTTTYTRWAKDKTCNPTFTQSAGSWKVTVLAPFTPGAISTTGQTICAGGDPTSIGSVTPASGGENPVTYLWKANGEEIASSNSATYDPPAGITTTTTYTRWAKDNACSASYLQSTGSWVVTVDQPPLPGTAAADIPVVCYNTPATIRLTDYQGSVQWQQSADGSNNWTIISGATSAVYVTSNLVNTSKYFYRAKVTNGVCDAVYSNVVKLASKRLEVSSSKVQYSDPVSFTATLYNGGAFPEFTQVTFILNNQEAGNANLTGTTNKTAVLSNYQVLLPAGTYTVFADFKDNGCKPSASLTVNREYACATYTGVYIASTGSATSLVAKVLLSATIIDSSDGNTGDIKNAGVQFYANGNPISPVLPVGVVQEGNTAVGSASYLWSATLSGTVPWATWLIYAKVVGNYYEQYWLNPCNLLSSALVTAYRPGPDFITGGGYLILQKPSGIIGADIGSENNFGFNVKYTKKMTNLQGNINIIVRKTIGEEEKVFHIKGTSLQSLSVLDKYAVFSCKATVQDITDPSMAKSVDGNYLMKVEMTDSGEPGTNDKISITVFDKSNNLYFSSRWEMNKPVMQYLDGGNLTVHSSTFKSAEIVTIPDSGSESKLLVYPNPFSDKLRFAFISTTDANARIDLFDMTGRLVKTVFNNEVKAGNSYQAEFRPDTRVSGMYLYRMTLGDQVFNGKVMYSQAK
jgi:hypothetical protein